MKASSTYRKDWIIRHKLECECGERWLILATQLDHDYYIAEAGNLVKRFMHRMYECPATTFNLITKEVPSVTNRSQG